MANYGSNNVTKLNTSGTVLGTFAVGPGPWGVAFDGANIWVTNYNLGNTVVGGQDGVYVLGSTEQYSPPVTLYNFTKN